MFIHINNTLDTIKQLAFLEYLYKLSLRLLDNPKNFGMLKLDIRDNFSPHIMLWPLIDFPENIAEVFFGSTPKTNLIKKIPLSTFEDGVYSFFIEEYSNLVFLPNIISRILQINCNICFNTDFLDTFREMLFIGLILYAEMISLRLSLIWFWGFNPYEPPLCYVCLLVDWCDAVFREILPTVLGINTALYVFIGFLGETADDLNSLVLTMPFLPNEAESMIITLKDSSIVPILLYHSLPIFWYKKFIPNEIRKFWYSENPLILIYMTVLYDDLNLRLLPTRNNYQGIYEFIKIYLT
uniref:Uncharacterized protein n=1 Tax=Nitzschia alba TaxID=2858 RepID=A0A5C0F2R1_NITAL|nr:hypothetical protein [Nitzschia alba]QEI59619.1 hypothetical protein [Nitzschia alba]